MSGMMDRATLEGGLATQNRYGPRLFSGYAGSACRNVLGDLPRSATRDACLQPPSGRRHGNGAGTWISGGVLGPVR